MRKVKKAKLAVIFLIRSRDSIYLRTFERSDTIGSYVSVVIICLFTSLRRDNLSICIIDNIFVFKLAFLQLAVEF